MRWHPDKFTQKFGARIPDREKEAVLDKVKSVYQSLQEQFSRSR